MKKIISKVFIPIILGGGSIYRNIDCISLFDS